MERLGTVLERPEPSPIVPTTASGLCGPCFFLQLTDRSAKDPSEEGKPYISGLYSIICSHSFAPFVIVVSLLTGSFSALCGTNNGKASAEAYYCAADQCYDKCCKSKHIISPFVVGVSLFLIRIIRPSSLQNACRTKNS